MPSRAYLAIIAGLLIFIGWLQLVPQPQDKVVFLDVGQGDSILFQDGTQQVLIDGGQGRAVMPRLAEELPWFDKTIDVLILTHPQRDHMEGLLHVLETYQVQLVLLPNFPAESQLQETWLTMLEERKIPYKFSWHGERLALQDLTFQIVAPFDTPEARAAIKRDINNASTTVRADYHGMSWLLSGDAETPAEKLLLTSNSLDVDILKAGHHGSKSSTSEELLEATTPATVIITVGKDNKYGHPNQEVLERLQGIPTFRTDQNGSVRFIHTAKGWVQSCGSKTWTWTNTQNSCMKSSET